MKLKIVMIIFGLFVFYNGHSQKDKDKYIYSSTTLNYYPELASYSFFKTVETSQDNLILNFLTSNTGTFVIEDVASQRINSENINKFPTQIFNIGASFQIRKSNSTFQEFSIGRFSSFKSSYQTDFTYSDSMGNNQIISIGYKQKSFIMSLRYEYGKMFGNKRSQLRFGIVGILEPNLYTYKREVTSSREFPIRATIFSLNIGLAPIVSCRISKKVFLDLKVIPRILIADFGEIKVNDPSLSFEEQKGIREYDLPEIDIASVIQLRYLLKEPKKRRRKSNN